jgi:PIN domain nuclease of toxin-antitoxin system
MILLLDAHALIWWVGGRGSLADAARRSIADPSNDVLVSAASIWELSIKQELGKLRIDVDLEAEIETAGFSGLPVTIADAVAAGALPRHHRDPFDRMLIAQASRLDAVIVTRDRAFASYDVKVLTA